MSSETQAGTPRILVVDDDGWTVRMVRLVLNSLKKRGYRIVTAADGEEGLVKAQSELPDLIITDVVMPKMNGWTMVKRLRAIPAQALVPVIFLTALDSARDRIHGFQLGADDYLPKPFLPEELDLRVAKALQRRADINSMLEVLVREAQAGMAPCLQGTLAQIGLPSLLTLLDMERKSGELLLDDTERGQIGRIYLREGRIVDAALEGQAAAPGAETVYHMLGWTRGRFQFQTRPVEQEDRVLVSTTHLLLEGSRRLDEANGVE